IQENVINRNRSWGITDGTVAGGPPAPQPSGLTNITGNTISDTLLGPSSGRGISFTIGVLISDNTISFNGGSGIFCGTGCVVTGNAVNGNNTGGIGGEGGAQVGVGSTVSKNSIVFNTGFGLTLPGIASASYTHNTIIGNNPGP